MSLNDNSAQLLTLGVVAGTDDPVFEKLYRRYAMNFCDDKSEKRGLGVPLSPYL